MAGTRRKPDLRIGPRASKFLDEVNATGNPGKDNELVEEFLAADIDPFRVIELTKDRDSLPSRSPWEGTPHIQNIATALIRLCQWHYAETGNPVFVLRTIALGQYLTARSNPVQFLEWSQRYVMTAIASVGSLVERPPAAEDVAAAFASAFGFERDKYKNPFREAAAIVQADNLYGAVKRLVLSGLKTTDALRQAADEYAVSYAKVRAIYYQRQKLAEKESINTS
jgi:hypothetical protein